eukprot:CAMPEP_0174277058 /NCGR_PEP_ID=MMETSP0439-20130205/60722_1 /TAXON_ID=0 /ORGANISM="Stereomyxa ramosa, Strain Chinc5" /LENGTH=112 /DNA_ID=CAMNT_0015369339 /DNA_START=1360 /DNA_END=1698 /DNA_ORIENTATION=-
MTTIIAVSYLGEELTLRGALGAIAIVVGLFVVTYAKYKEDAKQAPIVITIPEELAVKEPLPLEQLLSDESGLLDKIKEQEKAKRNMLGWKGGALVPFFRKKNQPIQCELQYS